MAQGKTRRAKTDPRRAVAYLRVSTTEQGTGLLAQRDGITAWAEREGVEIVAWHEDHTSGATPADRRPGMTAALADLIGHRAGLLVAWKRDRLARDPLITGLIEGAARRAGSRVVTADGLNGDDMTSEAMRGMLDVLARMERRMIGARTRDALQAKRARGEVVGTPPYGYRVHEGRYVPDLAEIHAIDRVMTLRRAGYPARVIADRLTAEGVSWPRARRWSEQTVWRIVRSQTSSTEAR
jgi:DNA invertase Pin-like site-specific DNA recombinase